jgi:hypothetical protein
MWPVAAVLTFCVCVQAPRTLSYTDWIVREFPRIVKNAQIGDYRPAIMLICKGNSVNTFGGAVWFPVF